MGGSDLPPPPTPRPASGSCCTAATSAAPAGNPPTHNTHTHRAKSAPSVGQCARQQSGGHT
eukprot:1897403-Rhodomonas_salina.2